MEILTKLNIKEKAEINFNDIRQRDSRQVELSKEEISRLIARYNSGIKDKKIQTGILMVGKEKK